MAYKLLCIYESKDSIAPELRIEVNLIGKSNSLAPFLRKTTVEDLYQDGVDDLNILSLLNHSGLVSQPFRIPKHFFDSSAARQVLIEHKLNYYQPNGKGSVKKSFCMLKPHQGHNSFPVGNLLEGELFIENPISWNKDIRVRFKYEDTFYDFLPQFSPIPFLTHSETLMLRDRSKEERLLDILGDNYNSANGTISIPTFSTDALKHLMRLGWNVYVAKTTGSHSKVFSHTEPSGITWFSTEENPGDSHSDQLLEGFLHGRNYQESNGEITLFNKEDVLKTANQSLAKQIYAPLNTRDLYAEESVLSKDEISAIDITLKNELRTTLRPYQRDGVLWLQQKRKNKHGCLLADEMGLGKTVQVIAHLCCSKREGRHLVIAPTSLIYNWQAEIQRFAPQLLNHIILVSYDMLRLHLEDYQQEQYDTIIIDEAQVIKNRQTKKYQAIQTLSSNHIIILTGTPIENSIEDIWSHFMILVPSIQSLYKRLQEISSSASREAYIALTAKFLKPFILRREKQSVLSDLPELTEKTVYVELSEKERKVYNNVHAGIIKAFSSGLTGRITSLALEGLLRLRQCCVSINLLPKSLSGTSIESSSKLDCALDYVDLFRSEKRQVLVFSQFVSALNEMEDILQRNEIKYVSLYGDTRDRESVVNKFQKNPDITVFLISLKAGGVGLNLTAADRVILLDDWWNPAIEDQAMGRAHRMGQKNNVLVLRLVCKDTVEEKILQLQDKKRQTVDMFNSTDDRITLDEIRDLLI